MKKGLWIILAIVVLAATYPGLAWYSGRTVEARLKDYRERLLAQAPYITVAEHQYERGIYRSHETTTYEFGRALFGAIAAAGAASGKAKDLSDGLRVTVSSEIQHGPFPGFGPPALARIDTEFVMSESVRRELAKAFGKRKPIEIVTRLEFGGGGATTVSSPAFASFPIGKGETLTWKGLTAHGEFGPDLVWMKMKATAPGAEVTSDGGESGSLEDIAFESNSELAFGDLYIGDAALSVRSLALTTGADAPGSGPKYVSMKGLEYGAKIGRKDDFLDVKGRLKLAALDVEPFAMSGLHYEVTLKHVHGPSVAEFIRAVRKSLAASPTGAEGAADSVFAKDGRRIGIEILKRDPEIVIDRIAFAMPEGDALLSGSVHLVGFAPADLDAPAAMAGLVRKIDARLDVSIAEGLLAKLVAAGGGERASALEQQVAALEAQGYVTRADGRLATHIEFRQGALTFNGKTFEPSSLTPPPAVPGKPARDTTHT
jgi:uncharacterized protein YdgA (DUF945 family)